MKKLIFVLFALFMTVNSFSQTTLTKDEVLQLHRKYDSYVGSAVHWKKIMSYKDWLTKEGLVDNNPYESPSVYYYNPNYERVSISEPKQILSPGDYLIKAKNQIFSGFGCQVISGITFIVNSNNDSSEALNIGAGVLGLLGLGLEISGIVNIGKAGVSLNENGIGIKVKF